LEADLASKKGPDRTFSRHLEIELYLRTVEHVLRDAQGKPYKITLRAPKGFFSDCALREFLRVAEYLNTLAGVPIATFRVLFKSSYNPDPHEVILACRSGCDQLPRNVHVMGDLVHEMGHGIYSKKFGQDKDWGLVYDLGLGWENYEIIDDSNYLPGADDSRGHPHSSLTESFASAVNAYYLHADTFKAYIQNRATPERMRSFGRLAWCFMRERIFGGRVFTSDKRDPFGAETTRGLLAALRSHRSPSLVEALHHNETRHAVDRFHPDLKDAVPSLAKIVSDGKADIYARYAAADALRNIGPAACEALPDLIQALKDPRASLASSVARVLGTCGAAAKPAESTLLHVVRNNPDVDRPSFVAALRKIGANVAAVVPDLMKILRQKHGRQEGWIVTSAIRSLGEAGPSASPAIPLLLPLLKDDRFALDVVRTLGLIGPAARKARPHLARMLPDEARGHGASQMRFAAAIALLRIGQEHYAAIPVLVKALSDPYLRADAHEALQKHAVPILVRELKDKNTQVRAGAANTLGGMGSAARPALPDLEKALNDPDATVRYLAREAIQAIGRAAAASQQH